MDRSPSDDVIIVNDQFLTFKSHIQDFPLVFFTVDKTTNRESSPSLSVSRCEAGPTNLLRGQRLRTRLLALRIAV